MIGDEISCLKNVGQIQLKDATSHCQSLNSSEISPRSKQESDDLVLALQSLNLASKDGKTRNVSIGIYKTNEGLWYDSSGQPITYFNWLPNEPDNLDRSQSYAGLSIDIVHGSAGWADYSGSDKLNVVCTKRVGSGKN